MQPDTICIRIQMDGYVDMYGKFKRATKRGMHICFECALLNTNLEFECDAALPKMVLIENRENFNVKSMRVYVISYGDGKLLFSPRNRSI